MNTREMKRIGRMLFALVLSVIVFCMPVYAADPTVPLDGTGVNMEVIYGYDDSARNGRYIPVEVEISDISGKGFEGSLSIRTMESDRDIYRYDYPVSVPSWETLDKQVYLPIGNVSNAIYVELTDEAGDQAAYKRINLNISLDIPELFIGVLSDTPQELSGWDKAGVDYSMLRTHTIDFTTETFPDDELGLNMFDVLLISNYRIRDLNEDQSRVLVNWVRNGGMMILGTGARADDTLGRFAPELLEKMYSEPEMERIYLETDYGGDSGSFVEAPCIEFSLSGGSVISEEDGRALIASTVYSRGTIAVAAFDFTDIGEFTSENPAYIDRLLTDLLGEAKITSLAQESYNGNSDQYWSIRNMVNTGDVKRLPNLSLYALEIIIYIFLAGIVIYIFLRQRDLTRLYKSVVIVLALFFTAIIYLMGSRTRFTDVFYTYAQFVDTTVDSINETAYVDVRAPFNRPFTAQLASGYSVKPVTRSYYLGSGAPDSFTGEEEAQVRIDYLEDKTLVDIKDVPAFDPRYFELKRSEENSEAQGFYGEVELNITGLDGTVTNRFLEDMDDCVLLFYDRLIYLGDLKAGESIELEGLDMLECPRGHSHQIAAYLSGESSFEEADIEDNDYVEAVEKTNILEYYLDNYMPSSTSAVRVIGIRSLGASGTTFLKTDTAAGYCVYSSGIDMYPTDDDLTYRSAMTRSPSVLGGNYDEDTNSLYGLDPVTIEYALGNDVMIERLTISFVAEEFIQPQGGVSQFDGNIYFYNHNTGAYDKMDPDVTEYERRELLAYLSPGNTITVRYAFDNTSEYNWDVVLPMINIVGRDLDALD